MAFNKLIGRTTVTSNQHALKVCVKTIRQS